MRYRVSAFFTVQMNSRFDLQGFHGFDLRANQRTRAKMQHRVVLSSRCTYSKTFTHRNYKDAR